jgi:hypothetical protein
VIVFCGPLHTLPVYPLGLTRRGALQAAISSGDMSTEGLEEEAWLVVQQHQEKLYAAGGKQAMAGQAHQDQHQHGKCPVLEFK